MIFLTLLFCCAIYQSSKNFLAQLCDNPTCLTAKLLAPGPRMILKVQNHFADARYDDKYIHLGAYDYNAEGAFRWVGTQTPLFMTPDHWLPGNPRSGGRRCLALQTWDWSKFGKWADSFCWVNLPFVCEVMTAPPFMQ